MPVNGFVSSRIRVVSQPHGHGAAQRRAVSRGFPKMQANKRRTEKIFPLSRCERQGAGRASERPAAERDVPLLFLVNKCDTADAALNA